MTIKVQQIGNFDPPFSTENELLKALVSLDVEVETFQENHNEIFNQVCIGHDTPDMVLWTRTRWQPNIPDYEQTQMLARCKERGVPVVGYHLDRWWGLGREHELANEPFFRVDTLYSADGGPHDWESFNINHKWLPPAVDEASCVAGEMQEQFKSELAFVGSWQGDYHWEHPHRRKLVEWLKQTYGDRCAFYPKMGEHAVRGKDLCDLYASVDVIIGDSCFTGTDHYWSDRIPETLGRGGYLIHPRVDGLYPDQFNSSDLDVWNPYRWKELQAIIEYALNDPFYRKNISEHGQQTVIERHTYKNRMAHVLREQLPVMKVIEEEAFDGVLS